MTTQTATQLLPCGDRLVVRAIPADDRTAAGIILPAVAQEKPQRGEVLAVGDGPRGDDGIRQPMDFDAGDVVLYSKYGGTEIDVDGEELMILKESDVLAKILERA